MLLVEFLVPSMLKMEIAWYKSQRGSFFSLVHALLIKITFAPLSSRVHVGMKDHLSCEEMETSKRITLTTLTNYVKASSRNSGKRELDNFFVFFKGELSTGFMSLPCFTSYEVAP